MVSSRSFSILHTLANNSMFLSRSGAVFLTAPGLQEAAARHFDEAFSDSYNEKADKSRREIEANETAY
jgi:hypothetical protein